MSPRRDRHAATRAGLTPVRHCIVFLVVLGAIFSRRPDMFLNAQFYAEDGRYWYAQAYNLGWLHSLAIPVGGYLNTLPRLVAGLTLLLPFRSAPLVMCIFGALVQALPVSLLLSQRCINWGPLPMRMLMAFIYVAIPNAYEIHVVLTNAQWHLALSELLLAFGTAPRTWAGRTFDGVIFVVGGISGPFCVLLTPLALFFWWKRRQPWTLVVAFLLAAGALVQGLYVVLVGRPKVGALGANPVLFLRMIGGNIFLDSLLGTHYFALHWPAWRLVLAAAAGTAFVAYAFIYSELELKLFALFAVALLLNALRAPFGSEGSLLWPQLVADPGGRYWYFPMITFLWMAVWFAFTRRPRRMWIASCCVLILLSVGMVTDWRYHPAKDHQFRSYAEKFAQAKPGEHLVIPINPAPWRMELIKH